VSPPLRGRKLAVALLLVAALISAGAWAQRASQAPSLTASIDPQNVSLGDRAILQLTLSSPTQRMTPFPNPPPLPPELVVRQTGNLASGVNIINGVMSYQFSQAWAVEAQREGRIEIPPIEIDLGGIKVSSQPLTLNVMPSPLQDLTRGRRLADPISATPGRALQTFSRETYNQHSALFRNRLYLLVCADNPEPYVGEQVNVSVYLVNGCGAVLEEPTFDRGLLTGLLSMDLVNHRSTNANPPFETFDALGRDAYQQASDPLGGEPVLVHLIRRVAIWPAEAGDQALGTLQAHSLYQVAGWNRYPEVVFTTHPIILHVQPLPGVVTGTSQVPVGRNFHLTASLTPTELPYDEAATLTVSLEGEALPQWFSAPEIDGGDLFRADPPPTQPEGESHFESDRLVGSRQFTYAVRFKATGHLTFPSVALRVFDVDKGDFVTLRSDPIAVQISPQASEQPREITNPLLAEPGPSPAPVASNVPLEIETSGFRGLRGPDPLATQTPLGWLLIAVPPLFFVGAVATSRRRMKLQSEEGFAWRTHRRAARNLRQAERARRRGDAEAFHTALAAAVHGHLTERLGTPTVGLSWPDIDVQLTERGVDEALRRRISDALAMSDFARFAPGVDAAAAMDQLHADTVAALRELGRQLPIRRNGRR
jgi:hypothetical protein